MSTPFFRLTPEGPEFDPRSRVRDPEGWLVPPPPPPPLPPKGLLIKVRLNPHYTTTFLSHVDSVGLIIWKDNVEGSGKLASAPASLGPLTKVFMNPSFTTT